MGLAVGRVSGSGCFPEPCLVLGHCWPAWPFLLAWRPLHPTSPSWKALPCCLLLREATLTWLWWVRCSPCTWGPISRPPLPRPASSQAPEVCACPGLVTILPPRGDGGEAVM